MRVRVVRAPGWDDAVVLLALVILLLQRDIAMGADSKACRFNERDRTFFG